jgi:hypothetical protein
MVWGTFMVDGEVNNGGFNQFFWNDSRRYIDEARQGYHLIGAEAQLALLDEALERYEGNSETLQRFRERNTLEAFSDSYRDDLFGDLDRRFFELDSHGLITSYIRSHRDEFVDQD